MVRSGIVVQVNRAEQTGIIEDKNGREFFFSIHECVDNELPGLNSVVTFVKDPDFKSTDVASLVKVSEIYCQLTGRRFRAA